MSNLCVDTIKSEDGNNGPVLDANLDFSQSAYTVLPKGTTAQRPTGVAAGSLRFNTDTKLVEQYNGTDWVTLNSYGVGRGVFGGGYQSAPVSNGVNVIDYITIATTGNASDFGDLSTSIYNNASCSSSTRGVFGGGITPTVVNIINYITIATTGNATDFGDLTVARNAPAACSSSTRGVFGGGNNPSYVNTIDYITIATTGNATDFGDLSQLISYGAACSSSTRGIFCGGYVSISPFNNSKIDYITITTTGNATNFGNLNSTRIGLGACSSSTRGILGGGYDAISTFLNTIDYITIASTGNTVNFGGILTQSRNFVSSCSSSTRGVFGGGYIPSGPTVIRVNTIDYITIASQGTNAIDFGDLTVSRSTNVNTCSDAHGGLA